MLIKIDVNPTNIRKIEHFIEEIRYLSDIRQFFNIAISNQIEEEEKSTIRSALNIRSNELSEVTLEKKNSDNPEEAEKIQFESNETVAKVQLA